MASREQVNSIKNRYNIVGNCDALNHAIDLATKVARVDLSVLVLGENGTGKEIIPRIIHDASARKGKKYLALNCGAIPEGTIDSELFGHAEGAFTGSVGRREGYFAAADGGTLFLDEVGELPLQTQVRLLRVLETGEFIPVGSNEPRKTNVRIVAATNVDMRRAIREGRFREDLFYRLSAVTIGIPPLRERGLDIDMLFRYFANENMQRFQIPPVRLNEAARQMLMHYPWPGNVRQLKNVVDSMSVLCEEREIGPERLAQFIPADESHTQVATIGPSHTPAQTSATIDNQDLDVIIKMIKGLALEVDTLKKEVAELKRGATPIMIAHHTAMAHHTGIGHHAGGATSTPTDFDAAEIYEEIIGDEPVSAATTTDATEAAKTARPKTMQELEEAQIRESLERNGGNRRKTAQELNLSERTLYRKINDYGLNAKNNTKDSL